MCGINGFITPTLDHSRATELANAMNVAIRHRGPDDQGVTITDRGDRTIALAQVRLSIVDLSSAGHQPMGYARSVGASSETHASESFSQDNITIVFNGEIYNFSEIREELRAKGYTFTTQCDTEVILASYLAWGTDCVHRFNGFWSFAIHDPTEDILFCSRDRFGKKPFYYHASPEWFIFSSEIKGILAHDVEREIDPEAIDFYFTTGFIPAPWSIWKSIRKLEAGHHLLLDLTTMQVRTERYYDLPRYAPTYDREALITEGKELLEDATRIRMFADVPVGAFLSGGLDSSSVVGEMTKFVRKENLHTFSIGFEGKYDETEYINIVADAFGTNHHHAYFQQEHFESMIDDLAISYDEPFGDYSSFPTTFVSRLAREHVTVALSGDGGDEIFGGYMMHQIAAQMEIIRRVPVWMRRVLASLIPSTSDNLSPLSKLREALRVSLLPKESFYAEIGGTTIPKPRVFQEWSREKLSYCLEQANGDFVQAMIDYDLMYNTLADNFLVKTDRASMSCALEIRSPFLDYRFVEYARRIPSKWKSSWRATKILMREIIRGIVPEAIRTRGKQGFTPPLSDWILDERYLTSMNQHLETLLTHNIIDQEWYNFYHSAVMSKNNTIFNVYKIRIFLLIRWLERWTGIIHNSPSITMSNNWLKNIHSLW